jgi:hypothetical protein
VSVRHDGAVGAGAIHVSRVEYGAHVHGHRHQVPREVSAASLVLLLGCVFKGVVVIKHGKEKKSTVDSIINKVLIPDQAMTTRQHLIEQDCMDRLGWSIEHVAGASDTEMLNALTLFESEPRVLFDAVPVPAPLPLISREVSLPPPVPPPVSRSGDEGHLVVRLRESIRLKTVCITSNELLTEDIALLKRSIVKDNESLQEECEVVRDQLDRKQTEETKKHKIRSLLQKVVDSVGGVDDSAHLSEVVAQLLVLRQEIQNLKQIVG